MTKKLLLEIPAGTKEQHTLAQPLEKLKIVVGEGAQLTFIEQLHGGLASPLQNQTELELKKGARVLFCSMQNFESGEATFDRNATLDEDAHLTWALAAMGRADVKSTRQTRLQRPGATVRDLEVFFSRGKTKLELLNRVYHLAPRTFSNILVKGAVHELAEARAKGTVRIEHGCKGAESFLAQHALLLSPHARAETFPYLEIEDNELKAGHAATVSKLDTGQVFYLTSRGLPEDLAHKLIVQGFLLSERWPAALQDQLQCVFESAWAQTTQTQEVVCKS